MPLKANNPIMVQITFSRNEDGEVEIETSAHFEYGAAEYPHISARKGIPITHTPTQEGQIKNFAKNVWLPQIEASL
uniref:Uncharacterized protein n=1 Tax=viral metagenome TaxID=1070528 RepID=A0A6M3K5A7_9ZZZZ